MFRKCTAMKQCHFWRFHIVAGFDDMGGGLGREAFCLILYANASILTCIFRQQ